MKNRISIRDCLNSNTAALRASTESIFERISSAFSVNTTVDLDFAEIRFISRSFAHSLVSWIDSVGSREKISFSNLNQEVSQMLELVRHTQDVPRTDYTRSDIAPSDDEIELQRDFLEVR